MDRSKLYSFAKLYASPLTRVHVWRPLVMAIPACLFLQRHQPEIEERFFDTSTRQDRFQLSRSGLLYRIGTRGPLFVMLFASSSYLWASPPYDRTAGVLIFTAALADVCKRIIKATLPDSIVTRRPRSQDYPRGGHRGFPSGHALISGYLLALYYPHGSFFTVPLATLAAVAVVPSLFCNCHSGAQIAAGFALGLFFGGLGARFQAALDITHQDVEAPS